MFELTGSQRMAVYGESGDLLVSAAAGSGKTAVLVRRLLERVCDEDEPGDIDEFIVITYTRAAAEELRGRIQEEMLKRSATDKRMRRQLAKLSAARITTIHGLCGDILREYALMAGISPEYRLADETESELIRRKALGRALDLLYAEGNPDFLALAEALSDGRGHDRRLEESIYSLREKLMACPDLPGWLARREEMAAEGRKASEEHEQALTAWARRMARGASELCIKALERMESDPEIERMWSAAFEDDLNQLEAFGATGGLEEMLKNSHILTVHKKKGRKSTGSCVDDSEYAALREMVKRIKKELSTRLCDTDECAEEHMPATRGLCRAIACYERELSESRKRGILSFSDLEHLTLSLLTQADGSPGVVAKEVGGRCAELLVDEYQDVNEVQNAIIEALASNCKLFRVGDARQSIYRFRLAEPRIFIDKYERYPELSEMSGHGGRKIVLAENFRSNRYVLEAVNELLSAIMSRETGEMEFTEREYLKAGRQDAEECLNELLTLDIQASPESAEDDSEAEDILSVGQEALMTARRVRELLDEKPGLKPEDIAILLRSPRSSEEYFIDALAAYGVKAVGVRGGSLFEDTAVNDLLAFMAVLDNPRQDLPLLTVLTSPVYGFGGDDLADLRAAAGEGALIDGLRVRMDSDEKAAALLDDIAELRPQARELSACELIWRIGARTEWRRFYETPDGLYALAALAAGLEGTRRAGLQGFLEYAEKLRQSGKTPAPGGEGVLRIMSIHGSKGLEFPVVFLAGISKRFNTEDSRVPALFHHRLGFGLARFESGVRRPSLARDAVALTLNNEMLSEEMRLLYVAMTRARDRLIVTYAAGRRDRKLEQLKAAVSCGKMSSALAEQASCYAHWLLPVIENSRHWTVKRFCGVQERPERPEPVRPEEKSAVPEKEFVYSHPGAALPSKLTATAIVKNSFRETEAAELAGQAFPESRRAYMKPSFAVQESVAGAAERGSALHLALQYADLSRCVTPDGAKSELDRLVADGLLENAALIAPDSLSRFANSSYGKRMLASKELKREWKFTVLRDAADLYGDERYRGERLLVQGIIDCAFREENGAWVLIDYKSSHIGGRNTTKMLKERYRPQLELYADALSSMTGEPVSERVLYFTETGAYECL